LIERAAVIGLRPCLAQAVFDGRPVAFGEVVTHVSFSLKWLGLSSVCGCWASRWSRGSVVAQFSFGACPSHTVSVGAVPAAQFLVGRFSRPERNWSSPGQELPRHAGAKA
jgi:hypothetical protein